MYRWLVVYLFNDISKHKTASPPVPIVIGSECLAVLPLAFSCICLSVLGLQRAA